jgi:SAM-dependent methyltransferase
VIDEAAAKRIILTPEGGSRTIERWTIETPYLVRLIMDHVILDRNSLVLDYGCGIRRIAKELIKQTGCHVIGVDISPTMLGLAYPYVHSDNFSAISQTTFRGLSWNFDLAICVWVLQHCLEPDKDIAYIYDALKDGGDLFVVNNIGRAVPTLERGWVDDSIEIQASIGRRFEKVEGGQLDLQYVPEVLHENAFWGLYHVD